MRMGIESVIIAAAVACAITVASCSRSEDTGEPLSFDVVADAVATKPSVPGPPIAPEAAAVQEKWVPQRVWLWFTMRNCAPCEKLYKRLTPEMAEQKLVFANFGVGGVAHVWYVKREDHPAVIKAWSVDLFPTLILVEDGREILRTSGLDLTGKAMRESLVNWRVSADPYRWEQYPIHEWSTDPMSFQPDRIPTGSFAFVSDSPVRFDHGDNALLFKELRGTVKASGAGRTVVFDPPKPQAEGRLLWGRVRLDINEVDITPVEAVLKTRWKKAKIKWEDLF